MTASQGRARSRLFWGVLLVTAGVALLLDPFVDSIHITVGRLWPLFFIILGLSKLVDGQGRRSSGGSWLVVLGGWLLLNTLSDWRYDLTWPVLVMFLGVRLIWTAFRGRRELGDGPETVHVD